MNKYTLYIDYKTPGTYDYIDLVSTDLTSAMIEAEAICGDRHYLATIMIRKGKITREDKIKKCLYDALLTNRGSGWYAHTAQHHESDHQAIRCEIANGAHWMYAI